MSSDGSCTGRAHYNLWFPLVIWATVNLAAVFLGKAPVLEGSLVGPDSYMRMERVSVLLENSDWFDHVIPRANWPHGEPMGHWSRPLDVLIIVLSWPFRLWLNTAQALFAAAVVISPLLQLAGALVIMRAAGAFGGGDYRVLVGVFFLLQPGLFPLFSPGRPDHHSLILLLVVVLLSVTLNLVLEAFKQSRAMLSGAVAALGLWVSVESLIGLLATLAIMGLFWIFSNREMERKGFWFAVAFLGATTLALLLERPPHELLATQFDRVSVVHWTLAGFVWVFWIAARMVSSHGAKGSVPRLRLGLSIAWFGTTALALWALFPGLFRGPFADADPESVVFIKGVQELKPLIFPDEPSLSRVVYWMGSTLAATPYLIWRIARDPDPQRRACWIVIGLYLLAFIPLAFLQVRWNSYTGVLTLFPYVALLSLVLGRISHVRPLLLQGAVRGLILSLFCGLPIIGGRLGMTFETPRSEPHRIVGRSCEVQRIAEHLNQSEGLGAQPRTVLANIFFGPELLYRTSHRVVGVPYHASASIRDTRRFFDAKDPQVARQIAEARAVDLVLICVDRGEAEVLRPDGVYGLRQRLIAGERPDWLTEIALPPSLAGSYRLFAVTP